MRPSFLEPGAPAAEAPELEIPWRVEVGAAGFGLRLLGEVASGTEVDAPSVDYAALDLEDFAAAARFSGLLRFHPWLALRAEYAYARQTGHGTASSDLRFGDGTFLAGERLRAAYEFQWAAAEIDIIPFERDFLTISIPVGARWISLWTSLRGGGDRGSERTASVFVPEGGVEVTVPLRWGFEVRAGARVGVVAALGKSGAASVLGRGAISWTFGDRFRIEAGFEYVAIDIAWRHDGLREEAEIMGLMPFAGFAVLLP